MGLPKDLKLEGNNFSDAATAFFIAYLVAEVPTGEFSYVSTTMSANSTSRVYTEQSTRW